MIKTHLSLVLVDGFLQYEQEKINKEDKMSQSLF